MLHLILEIEWSILFIADYPFLNEYGLNYSINTYFATQSIITVLSTK